MSERETKIQTTFQRWRGCDQVTQPTLVASGFFVMTRGTFFSIEGNAERLPGKVLSARMSQPVFHIATFGTNVFLQGLDKVWMVDLATLQESFTDPDVITLLDETGNFLLDESGDPLLQE